MSPFLPPASGPIPPLPELAELSRPQWIRFPRRRLNAMRGREHFKRQVLEALQAFLVARADSCAGRERVSARVER